MTRFLDLTHEGDVAVLRMNRPPANALDLPFTEEIAAMFESLAAEPPGALVFTGTGGSFSAGLDLKALPTYSIAEQDRMVRGLNRLCLALYGFPRPTVAAVNGHAVAGGMILLLGCDRRVVAQGKARFGLTEGQVGVAFPMGALEIARAELGLAAGRWMMGAGTVDGPAAKGDGALDEIVPAEEVLPRAMTVAMELATHPLEAYGAIKQQIRRAALDRIRQAAEQGDPVEGRWLGPDIASRVAALLGKG